jgi:hypothetical protein
VKRESQEKEPVGWSEGREWRSGARDVTSESEEDETEGVEWGARKYGVRMSPTHPWYVGRGDDTCGGEVVYTIQEIKELLDSQPEDMKRWLTTSQTEWALTREEHEVVNEKDNEKGVALGVDGSCKDGKMGSGCCKFKEEGEGRCARVGREEEGTSSNRPELGGVVLALHQLKKLGWHLLRVLMA